MPKRTLTTIPRHLHGLSAGAALVTALWLTATPGHAQESVHFTGLHAGKAVLTIDRRRVLLAPGDIASNGVELVSVNPTTAVVRMAGASYRLSKGVGEPEALLEEVTIERRHGLFFTNGEINGQGTEFIVDTGASHVVLSADEARRLRLRYATHDSVRVQTASGQEIAYPVTLDSVAVGDIVLSAVPALVIRGRAPDKPLLGMSFLSQLQFSQTGTQMLLRR